ncbi:FAD-linked oxidoreductase [Amanita rubescens]|nr:FAD-linked oxidoreductase [Amanita rubescens]
MYRSFFRVHARNWTRSSYRRNLALATISSGTLGFALTKQRTDTNEHSNNTPNHSLSSLVRAYAVYSMCSVPSIVEYSPHILRILLSVPVVRQITEVLVRVTFFNQFVGGDTARDTIPVLRTLRAENKGALLVYSGNPSHKRFVEEMIKTIDTAADFEDSLGNRGGFNRRTCVALKLSALLPDAHALIKLSAHILKARSSQAVPFPGSPTASDLAILHAPSQGVNLTQKDIESLRELHADLESICSRAKERDVKVVIDAEYSWYQPAVDAFQLSMMRKFNVLDSGHTQPLVYGTWQAYLRRNPGFLAEALRDARMHNYALGVKLVRGAYHEYEIHAHSDAKSKEDSVSISPDPEPPVWMTKSETDACFNEGVRTLVKAIATDVSASWRDTKNWWSISRTNSNTALSVPRIAVIFGTHNRESCDVVLEELVKANLASKEEIEEEGRKGKRTVVSVRDDVAQRIAIAQLYGMCDDLTDSLVERIRSKTPLVMKYLPYGALSEVLPYLGRRAIENKAVLGQGGAERERKRAWRLIRARIFGQMS